MSAPPDRDKPYVFLSYAGADRPQALRIADLLEGRGIPVWIDRHSIAGGTTWSAEIVRGIRGCGAVAVLVSPAAMASPNVQQEVQLAWEGRRPVLPLILEPATYPEGIAYALAGRQWVEVGEGPEDIWLPRAVRALAGLGIGAGPIEHGDGGPGTAPGPVGRSVGGAAPAGEPIGQGSRAEAAPDSEPRAGASLRPPDPFPPAPSPVSDPSRPGPPRESASARSALPSSTPFSPPEVPGVSGAGAPLSRLLARAPLVGRAGDLAYLCEQYEAAMAGQGGRLVLIGGEPGAGKTRLAQEVGAYAATRGGLFLAGHYLRDGTAAYGPWVEALRAGLRSVGAAELAEWANPYGPDLAQAVPDLVAAIGPQPDPPAVSPDERRRRLFDGVANLVIGLSGKAPLVVLLDDLQWAPGLGLLAHVGRRLGEARALIVGTYRDQELKEQPALVRDWAELNRARLATEITLHRLSEAETTGLIAHYFGEQPARQLGGPVYDRTHGNAFFTEEVLRTLTETGAVRLGPDGWEVAEAGRVAIPESMTLAVQERIARLDESARELLIQAAVLGQEFAFDVVGALSGRSQDDLLSVIEEAQSARILVDRSGGGEERYGFWDDQMQEVLYEGIPTVRRRRLHLRAGQAIEEVCSGRLDAHLEELARHFSEGNDATKAAGYALRAAEKNEHLFNWPRARHHYERAADALTRLPDHGETRRRRIDTLLKLAASRLSAGNSDQSLASLAEAETVVRALLASESAPRDRERLAHIQYWMGRFHYQQGRFGASREYLEQALAWARAAGDEGLALLCSRTLGAVCWLQGYPGQAVPLLVEPAKRLERIDRGGEWIWTLGILAMSQAATGDYAAGLAAGKRALDRARTLDDPRGQCFVHVALASVYFAGGDFARMREASQASLIFAEETGERVYARLAVLRRAWAESRLGQHAAARSSLAALRQVDQSLGRGPVTGLASAVAAEIELSAGQIQVARTLAEQAIVESAGSEIFALGVTHRVWGQALAFLDLTRWSEVEDQLAASLRWFEEGGHRLEAARTRIVWGTLLRDRGDRAAAREHLAKAAAQFEASGLTEELERTRTLLTDLGGQNASGPTV